MPSVLFLKKRTKRRGNACGIPAFNLYIRVSLITPREDSLMAKFLSVDELDTFEFHDARFQSIEIGTENMTWELEQVNVTTKNSQNNFDVDMEAGVLLLSFKNWKATRIEYYGSKTYDQKGNLIKAEPGIIASVEDYHKILTAIPVNHGWISRISRYNKDQDFNKFTIDILTHSDSLIVDLEYSEVKAEWDVFLSEAWYVNWNPK